MAANNSPIADRGHAAAGKNVNCGNPLGYALPGQLLGCSIAGLGLNELRLGLRQVHLAVATLKHLQGLLPGLQGRLLAPRATEASGLAPIPLG